MFGIDWLFFMVTYGGDLVWTAITLTILAVVLRLVLKALRVVNGRRRYSVKRQREFGDPYLASSGRDFLNPNHPCNW
jgi:heme exporter protein D